MGGHKLLTNEPGTNVNVHEHEPLACCCSIPVCLEREAFDWLRNQLTDRDSWHAWTNFELIEEAKVNEVDALILTSVGLFLVEFKSRPCTVTVDAHTWLWITDGRDRAYDNPLILANRKSKRHASLLRRQLEFPPCHRTTEMPCNRRHAILARHELHRVWKVGARQNDVQRDAGDRIPRLIVFSSSKIDCLNVKGTPFFFQPYKGRHRIWA